MPKGAKCLEFFCLDCCKHHEEPEAHPFAKIRKSKKNSHHFISEKFESLDYEDCENQLIVEEEKRYGLPFMIYTGLQRYIIFILIGITTGLVGFFVEMSVEVISCWKFKTINEYTLPEFANASNVYFIFVLFTLVPASLGSLLVVFIEPVAEGGGVAGLIGFLNGVRIPRLLKLKTMIVKVVSLILAVVSGMALGKEGPLVHIGTTVGATMPLMHVPFTNIRPFRYFHCDQERRDFAAAGFAAGLTAAFGTPMGGMLMVLEEGLSFWSADLTFKIFLCAITCGTVYSMLLSVFKGFSGQLMRDAILFFSAIKERSTTYYVIEEIPMFILVGILGAIFGSMWTIIQKYLILLRMKIVKHSVVKFLEVLFVALLTISTGFLAFIYITDCSPSHMIEETECYPRPVQIQGFCKKGEFHTMALFIYQNGQLILDALFNHHYGLIGIKPLIVFGSLYYFWSVLTMGTAISGGIFVPNLVTGAAWGRLLAFVIHQIDPNAESWAQPNKYAFLGSAAQLCGVTRLTFSLGVMYIEATGSTHFGVPIFVILITTKFVGMFFCESVFHTQAELKGMPILAKAPPPLCLDVRARDVMAVGPPLETLPQITTVDRIVQLVLGSRHNGFPIVDPSSTSTENGVQSVGRLKGLILKSQLVTILKKRDFSRPTTPEEFKETLKLFRNQLTSRILVTERDLEDLPLKEKVDLTPYMNPQPYVVKMDATLSHTHKLFAELGLRHLVVINELFEVVGIVTRKDLAVFKKEFHACRLAITQLDRRP